MVYSCFESYFRWLEWILWWEVDFYSKCSFVVRRRFLKKDGRKN
jgi:hypothetical protein